MRKLTEILETVLYFTLTALLVCLFLLNLPLFQEPHGFLVMNELSDFSSTQLSGAALFGSAFLCALLGALTLKWAPELTIGTVSNLWATTFFLLWVDSMFTLSIQFRSLHYLAHLGLGLFFLYLFFFTLHYLGYPVPPAAQPGDPSPKPKIVHYCLAGWIAFYFWVSARLLLKSYGYPEFQGPLAMGFCVLGFLNYLLLLHLKKSQGADLKPYSRIGRFLFSLWFLALLAVEIGQKWVK